MCVCVCQHEKESARRMASTTSENRKRNEKKSTEQEEAHFVSRVTVILTKRKRERLSTKSTRVCVCVCVRACVHVCVFVRVLHGFSMKMSVFCMHFWRACAVSFQAFFEILVDYALNLCDNEPAQLPVVNALAR